MADSLSCKLNRTWVLKMTVFLVVLLAFGFWSLYDAAILYPARGLADASYQFKDYLAAAESAGFLTADRIAATDPAAELSALNKRLGDLRSAAGKDSQQSRSAAMDLARHGWLSALERSWKLNPAPKPLGEFITPVRKTIWCDPAKGVGYARAPDGARSELTPQAMLDTLRTYWNSAPARPTPLSSFDLPVQWLFVAVGFGLSGYLIFLLARCKSQAVRTRFEPEAQRLSLPGGASFTPADLEDLDKRLWHKYFVIAILKDSSHHKLDLLRYVPLEDWVLGMERTRFPERAAEEAAAAKQTAEEQNPSEPPANT